MGRQLALILDEPDEALLLEYLKSLGPLRLFETSGPAPDELWLDRLPPVGPGHYFLCFWPTAYDWQPVYAQTQSGGYYIRNHHTAPILEYSRTPLDATSPGRFYWARRFAGEPTYDIAAFDRWVSAIWRWVRRTARKGAYGAYEPVWLFPAAFARLTSASSDGAA